MNMIESIRVRNFKCIKDLSLDLAPLTILIGKNGSGKSSILEAIAVMNQSLGISIDKGLKKGPIEFGRPENAYHKGEEKPSFGFGARLSTEEAERIRGEFNKDIDKVSKEMKVCDEDKESLDELEKVAAEVTDRLEEGSKVEFVHNDYLQLAGTKIASNPGDGDFKRLNLRLNLRFNPSFLQEMSIEIAGYRGNYVTYDMEVVKTLTRKIEKLYYITSFRGSFPWEYKVAERENYVGKSGEYTIEVISSILRSRDMEKIRDLEFFSDLFGVKGLWAGYFGRGDKLTSACLEKRLWKSVFVLPDEN